MKRFADYEIVHPMGQGNHGTYYAARPPARLGIDDELVALKVLGAQALDDDFRRIANELRLLNSLRSPHLIELLDAGNASGQLFFASRYYADGSLEEASGRLDDATILQAVADAATGAHQLHEVGVAHRDIKPTNILIDDSRGRLSDLGLAQMFGGATTTIGAGPIGSLEYIEPSVIRGQQASRRSDIWSLGLTLHRALTGVGVYGTIPDTGILDACRHVLHTRPSLHTGLDGKVGAVIERSTAENPDDRYSSAIDFAADVADLIRKAPQ